MNPRLIIDLEKLTHNAAFLADLCGKHGIGIAAVTKVFCAEPEMVKTLAKLPIDFLADSRIENIMSYPKDIPQKTMLLRLAAPSEARRVVEFCDISLNSEIKTLEALAEAARARTKIHGVIIMIDLGDLREGIYHSNLEQIEKTARYVLSQKSLKLAGFGTNLTCYGSVLPTSENMGRLCEIVNKITNMFHVEHPLIISGGNSSALNMLKEGEIPKAINNLRLGESIVCGKETAFGEIFCGLKADVVTLEAEIIEIADKPSFPEGKININAFGEIISYEDRGRRRRAILAVGRQDVNHEGLECHTPGAEIVGASSDHLIVDITDCDNSLDIGDRLTFSMSYGAVLAGFTSKYLEKHYK